MSGRRSDAELRSARSGDEDVAGAGPAVVADMPGGVAACGADDHAAVVTAGGLDTGVAGGVGGDARYARASDEIGAGPAGPAATDLEPAAKRARSGGGPSRARPSAAAGAEPNVASSPVGEMDIMEIASGGPGPGPQLRRALQSFLASTGMSEAALARRLTEATGEQVRSFVCFRMVSRFVCLPQSLT